MHQSRYKYRVGALLRVPCLTAICATTLLAAQPATADGVPSVYEMSVIEDTAQGRRLTKGDYTNAIEELEAPALFDRATFAKSNNLCVAYTMTMKFDEAALACDAALEIRERVRLPAPWYASAINRTKVRDKALALSNRGVLRAVTGDVAGARADFERAIALEAELDAPEANLIRLDAKAVQSASTLKNDR